MPIKQKLSEPKFRTVFLFVGLLLLIIILLPVRSKSMSSPQKTLELLLIAMQNSNMQQIEKLTTREGLNALKGGKDEDEYLADWKRWAEIWSGLDVSWQKISEHEVLARIGDEMKESGLIFTNGPDGWKLSARLIAH